MDYRSKGPILGASLLAAILLFVTIVMSAMRLLAQVPQVQSTIAAPGAVSTAILPGITAL
jgi:hypothetical protein